MKTLIALLVIWLAINAVFIYGLINQMDGFRQIQKAQEDAISRIAGKQFEDSKSIADAKEAAEKLSQCVTHNSRELDKLKRFTYRLSTHPEDMTDGFQGK